MSRIKHILFVPLVILGILVSASAIGDVRPISLDEAKEIANNYLALLQAGEYRKAQESVFRIDQGPELKDLDVLSKKCFFEEFGNISSYSYKEFSPTAYSDLVLHYEVTYADQSMDKEIVIGERDGGYRIVRTSDDIASSSAAAKKMILVMKRISEHVGSSR